MNYLVNWNYQAEWKNQVVRLFAGETVTLDADVAEFVLRDSPGCLTPTAPALGTLAADTAPAEGDRALDEAPQDRQLKRAPKQRADRTGDPGDDGPITTKTFKAVKNK